jgi:ABC-2 type transport system permease protein
MSADLLTMMWKEAKDMLLQQGGWRSGIVPMVIIPLGVFGVMLPWQMGRAWVDSPMTLAVWAWMPLMLMSSLIADSFAGERERHTLETLLASRLPDRAILFGKVCAVVCYGWGLTLLGVLLGLLTVNLAHGKGRLLLYSAKFALGIVVVSGLTAWLAAGAGVLISLRATTVRQAQQTLTIAVMLLLFVPVYGVRLLPKEWQTWLGKMLTAGGPERLALTVIAILAVLDVVLLSAALARFKRARLILD